MLHYFQQYQMLWTRLVEGLFVALVSRCPFYYHAMMINMSNESQERVDRKSWSDIESLTTFIRILFCLPLILIFGFGFMAHTLSGSAAKHVERRYYIPLPTIILHVRFSVRCVRLFLVLDSSSASYSYLKLDRLAVAFHALLDDVAIKQFLPFEIVHRFHPCLCSSHLRLLSFRP